MAAAYAAFLALARSLREILDLKQYVDPLHKPKIRSLKKKVDFIVTFLENYSDKHHGTIDCVGNGIGKAAFEAQDFVDSYLCSVSPTDDGWSFSEDYSDVLHGTLDFVGNGIRNAAYEAQDFMDPYLCWVSTTDHDDEMNLDRDLTMASQRIDFILEETMKMNNSDAAKDLRSVSFSSPIDHSSTVQSTARKMAVGFENDLMVIKERLYEDAAELQIIPIVGMGGIGKTTLATRAYEDSILSQCEAQDFLDSYYCSASTADDYDGSSSSEDNGDEVNLDGDLSEDNCDEVNLDGDLTIAFERIGFIWEKTMKMKNTDTAAQDLPFVSYSSTVDNSSTVQEAAKKMVVGFDDDLIAIKELLYEDAAELQIIPIVGMGGIGKTTLARRAYEDSILSDQYFDICAWITMSQEYQRREILSGLLKSLKNEQSDDSEAELAKLVYQNLMGRRYLIVIDDMWSTKAWDDLKMIFPDDGNGSRILLTTRLLDVASHAGSSGTPVHQMKCLDEDQSWKLLQERVFGQQSCPPQLVDIGKKIAENCGGLPLTIVVVAGVLLLSSGQVMREQLWENVLENITSREPTIALPCSKILCFSYDRLPLRLKPCFLYIAGFPEDSEIDVPKLIKLWVAEGFLKPNDGFKCLEDVGERYLQDLVNRSLLLVIEKGPDGKLETVGIHDMLREICIRKAEEEGFLHHVSSDTNSRTEFIENPHRRLKIYSKEICLEWDILDSSVRSILLVTERLKGPTLYLCSRHICILDAPHVTLPSFSNVVSIFVNLRYFAFAFDYASCPRGLPVSILKHPNLETIVVHVTGFRQYRTLQAPYGFLTMPKLRHLTWDTSFSLSHPSYMGIVHVSGLQTIETVKDLIFTQETIRILVNLKKLKVEYDMENFGWEHFNLHNLFHLRNLEDLQISTFLPSVSSMTWNHTFPIGLKKLFLNGFPMPWGNMTIIGSLPNLQVLEMMHIKLTKDYVWTTEEGQFLQLKYFRSSLDGLVKWETEKEHFPCLETLILDSVVLIDEIPSGIGEIDTLRYIELRYCIKSLVGSANQIQMLQQENGNDDFRVRVVGANEYDVLSGKAARTHRRVTRWITRQI